jgi:hypothetical protein
MPVPKKKARAKKRTSAKLAIGRERFIQISAVEGIKPTAAMEKRMAEFDRQGLSAAEKIIKAYRKG